MSKVEIHYLDGEYEGLYIDGRLAYQHEQILACDVLRVLGIDFAEVNHYYEEDAVADAIYATGITAFPQTLDEMEQMAEQQKADSGA